MAYTTGILDKRIEVYNRSEAQTSAYGKGSGGYTWAKSAELWAAVDWSRGTKALREGAVEAYDTLMIRCRWTDKLTRESRIKHDDRTYQIDSFHADKHANTIQITCTEITA